MLYIAAYLLTASQEYVVRYVYKKGINKNGIPGFLFIDVLCLVDGRGVVFSLSFCRMARQSSHPAGNYVAERMEVRSYRRILYTLWLA